MPRDPALPPFEAVVAAHGGMVMRICRAQLPPAEAADAWSETFLAALQAYPELRPGSNVRAWVATIAHRKAIDQLRSAARRPQPAETLPEPPTGDSAVDDEELRAALRSLPPKQRGALIYRYFADLSYAEIGQLLESSADAARRSAADGIARLRKLFDKGRTR